jgi:hypothetical protein
MSSVPIEPTHLVNKTYVDDLVETSGFASRTNFYVSMYGDDNRFNIPTYKRGRNFAYDFKTGFLSLENPGTAGDEQD